MSRFKAVIPFKWMDNNSKKADVPILVILFGFINIARQSLATLLDLPVAVLVLCLCFCLLIFWWCGFSVFISMCRLCSLFDDGQLLEYDKHVHFIKFTVFSPTSFSICLLIFLMLPKTAFVEKQKSPPVFVDFGFI